MPTVLAIVPHPDDESYAFGGLLALLSNRGWRCVVHCASSGEGGQRHDGGPMGPEALARAREGELATSCEILGAEPPVCWRLPDGGLRERNEEGMRRTREAFKQEQPELVLTLGPDGAYGHPDHLAVHAWVRETRAAMAPGERPALLFVAFSKGLFLPQWEKCRDMMGDPPNPPPGAIGTDSFDFDTDTASVAERKLRAIGAHRTQLPGGDPHAIFPAEIVAALLDRERYVAADDASRAAVRELLGELAR